MALTIGNLVSTSLPKEDSMQAQVLIGGGNPKSENV